jgi:hypothetical protein
MSDHPKLTAKLTDQYLRWRQLNHLVNESPIPAMPKTVRRLARLKRPAGWQSWEQLRDAVETKEAQDEKQMRLSDFGWFDET